MSGMRKLRVVAKTRESRLITSFELAPVEPGGWRPFEAGQFLVLRVPGDSTRPSALRTYSVSCAPGHPGRYRISVKREAAPRDGVPPGLGSCWLHDHVAVGDLLDADGPRGDFVLDRASARPVVLLSGGVGLTPLVSMLHALAEGSDRAAHFIHACDNGEVHALGDEVRALVASRPGLVARFVYRTPSDADRAGGDAGGGRSSSPRFDAEGIVTRELLQRWLPLDDYDFYLCGPPPFMQGCYRLLRSLGVPKARIAYEFFGPATVLDTDDIEAGVAAIAAAAPPAAISDADAATAALVSFRKSGRSAHWQPGCESLLAFAEEQGLQPDFSCRAGVCGSCRTALVSGAVDYFEDPLDDPGAGQVLLCCSRPRGPVVLDL